MKRILVVALGIVLLATVALAGEKEELTLQKQLIETQLANIQMQVQLLQNAFKEKQGELQVVVDKIRLMEPKKEEPKKSEQKGK